jgi:hypothetical protein
VLQELTILFWYPRVLAAGWHKTLRINYKVATIFSHDLHSGDINLHISVLVVFLGGYSIVTTILLQDEHSSDSN